MATVPVRRSRTLLPEISINIQEYSEAVVYRNLIIQQSVNEHHHFSFIWNVGEIRHDVDSQLNLIKNNIGSRVTIEINDVVFEGIITQMTVNEQTDSSQSFIVKGQGLTILLDDTPHSASYYKKDLKKIINSTLEGIPGNVLQTDISPKDSSTKHYIVQYNETDWQFLQRLATRYGEWLYFDGTHLRFGKINDSNAELRSGSNLTRYSINANLVPNQYNYSSYDYHRGEPVSRSLGSFSAEVQNDFSTSSADKSKEIYSRTVDRPMHSFNLINKEMLDSVAELDKQRLASQLLIAKGESRHGALRPGYKFVVSTGSGNYDYVAMQVTHLSNNIGHYENNFVAVPASVNVPPYTNPHVFRQANIQTAIVKENHDPDGINRVKVQFFWQKQNDMTPWIRVITPHAGGGKGIHFIPEKGEEVMVDFEGGDIDKPFVAGSMFHGRATSGQGDSNNYKKIIKSNSGALIEFDDELGQITIMDKSNNFIQIDGSGNITILCENLIQIESQKDNIEFKAGKDIILSAKNNIKLETETQKITITANTDIEAKSTTANVILEGATGLTATAISGGASISAPAGEAKVDGLTAKVNASSTTDIKGALIKLNGE